ncbi:MAG: hypothetical protein WAQ28_14730 [Bacteroidia bacterium]
METNNNNFSEGDFLPGIEKKNAFILPDTYFNGLSARVMERIEFEKELEEYETLSGINRQLKFSIPANYFENLTNILDLKYESIKYPTLKTIPKHTLSEPPADYFETLHKNIANKMEYSAELGEFAILSSLQKKNNFTVAPSYFEKTEQTVKETGNTAGRPKGLLRQLGTGVFQPKIAIAASLALIVGMAAFFYLKKTDSALQTGDCKTLACLEKYELLNEKNINDFDDENLYEMVDVEELDKNVSVDNTVNDSIKKNKEE